ncbi:MAG: hypothetical protein J1F68_01255 [Clostridiales bacterium]|nr:hypothetical protein [Clostridiales bacterium]
MICSEDFKNKFHALIDPLGMSSKESCAMLIGIPFGAFNNAYNYGKFPQIDYGIAIAEFFGVSLDFLFRGADGEINKSSNIFYIRFNKLLDTLEEKDKLKQAKLLGLPPTIFHNACSGFYLPAKLAKQVAGFFGVSVDFLLGLTDERN